MPELLKKNKKKNLKFLRVCGFFCLTELADLDKLDWSELTLHIVDIPK